MPVLPIWQDVTNFAVMLFAPIERVCSIAATPIMADDRPETSEARVPAALGFRMTQEGPDDR